jgi:hypothetical protein
MAYLGRGLDKISNIEVLDNITFDGSSSYSITKNSVAFVVNSAQSLLISIDGVVQATNFTVNGSTIDFGVAIPSTSVCNFFLHYGTGVLTVPSDGSVTTAKLGNSAVDLTSKVTGALPVANGGTGVTTASALANTGNLVLLNSQTVTTAVSTVAFDNTYFTDDYEYYKLMFYRVMPSTGSSSLHLEYSTDNGSNFISGAINSHRRYMLLGTTANGSEGDTGLNFTRFATNITSTASRGLNGEITFFNFRQAWTKFVNAHTIGQENSNLYQWRVGSWINNASKINYMRFFWSGSGRTFTDGRFDLYGVKS